MLPYGTLWKLDQLLHPPGPPQRRTVALRRRQALFLFLWGVTLTSLFLFPFHYAALRRQRLDIERELLGLAAPTIDADSIQQRREQAVQRLKSAVSLTTTGAPRPEQGEIRYNADDVTADFARAFYFQSSSLTRLDGVFAHRYVRALAGGGAGVLWPLLGDAPLLKGEGHVQNGLQTRLRPRTLKEKAMLDASRPASQYATCLLALRREILEARVNAVKEDNLIQAVYEALQRFQLAPLYQGGGGRRENTGDAAVRVNDEQEATEVVLAALFLWIADAPSGVSDAAEEALSRAVAGCEAPFSRTLQAVLNWGPPTTVSKSPTLTFHVHEEELEMTPMQFPYLCLCSRRGQAQPALVEINSGIATPLFLLDPQRVNASRPTCFAACALLP